MPHPVRRAFRWPTLLLAGALLTAGGCTQDQEQVVAQTNAQLEQGQAATAEGQVIDFKTLPSIKPEEASQVSLQRLARSTPLEENVAVHVKLAPPVNKELEGSLVRVVGTPDNPTLLFNSDALAQIGAIPSSPGKEFFTSFSQFDTREIERRISNERLLESGELGRVSPDTVVFNGRTPVGITQGIRFNPDLFDKLTPQPLSLCPATPVSTTAGWGQSLFITSPTVVLNPQRTWDPCTGAGTQGGVWTFAHLMRQMAINSGTTAETFVLRWLEQWLNNQTINGDVVPARTAMFNQVIQPWATASGVTAQLLINSSGQRFVQLSGPLNLNIAPFRLLSIINRLDLGRTASGFSGYGGSMTSQPVDAGELRFIFQVVQPNPWGGGSQATCGLKPFTVIFEYGVPITGCSNVVQWARNWTMLNQFGGFTAPYLSHLQTLTQSVVMNGVAPTKGNQSALNQIRTNENALNTRWELREFTLTDENPPANTDTPSNGLLRKHTVAQTPDDAVFPAVGSPVISNFVMNVVKPSVPLPVGPLPANCSSGHTVPFTFGGFNFRGGNSLVAPTHWEASGANPGNSQDVCARHQFSLNTCNGCHFGDTQTPFTHVSTGGIPVNLSNFLTGGGPGLAWGVGDTQFGAPVWRFADLERRWKNLYNVAFCVECTRISRFDPAILDRVQEIARAVPIDPIGPIENPRFQVGPIRDLESVKQILEVRHGFGRGFDDHTVDFIRTADPVVH